MCWWASGSTVYLRIYDLGVPRNDNLGSNLVYYMCLLHFGLVFYGTSYVGKLGVYAIVALKEIKYQYLTVQWTLCRAHCPYSRTVRDLVLDECHAHYHQVSVVSTIKANVHLIYCFQQIIVDLLADDRVELIRWMGPHKVPYPRSRGLKLACNRIQCQIRTYDVVCHLWILSG